MTDQPSDPRDLETGFVGRVARGLAVLGGFAMLATAAMVTLSVGLRWFGAAPVPGDFEIVQMAMAVIAFAALPICQLHRANIAVDTFTTRLPRQWNAAIDAAWDVVYAAMAALIAYTLALGAIDTLSNNTQTMVLTLPLWPAVTACAVLAAFLAVVALTSSVRRWRADR